MPEEAVAGDRITFDWSTSGKGVGREPADRCRYLEDMIRSALVRAGHRADTIEVVRFYDDAAQGENRAASLSLEGVSGGKMFGSIPHQNENMRWYFIIKSEKMTAVGLEIKIVEGLVALRA